MKIGFLNTTNVYSQLIKILFIAIVLSHSGCKKLVEIDPPPNALSSENVYTTDATAISVLNGIYVKMSGNNFAFVTGGNSISVWTGFSSDELTLAGGTTNSNAAAVRFYTNTLNAGTDVNPWFGIYSCLIMVNTALDKLKDANTLTPSIKDQLLGEAKFLRALCLFYLVNFYGDLPLVISSDYRINANLSRAPKSEVYQQIISDLKDAQNLLSESFFDATLLKTTQDRVRPTKWAATALLARAFLYIGDWVNAEIQASTIVNNSIFGLSTLNTAFLKASLGNKEAIWQLQPVISGSNTEDGKYFVLNGAPGPLASNKQAYLDTLLVKSFEANDSRRTNWIKDTVVSGNTYSYVYKYKIAAANQPVNEYLMVLRLAEQYLIRAEARAQQNKISEAIADLDKVRQRASLTLIANTNPLINKNTLLNTILHERQVELFTEWGHRWLDLKRTNTIDAVMSVVTPLKGGKWSSNWSYYPIPDRDILLDLNLSQNDGY